jgi:hypothetical protein
VTGQVELQSRPYQPDPKQCCEACVFGRGQHAEWCATTAPAASFALHVALKCLALECFEDRTNPATGLCARHHAERTIASIRNLTCLAPKCSEDMTHFATGLCTEHHAEWFPS